MGRKRNAVTLNRVTQKGDRYFVYLKHPVRKKTVCFALGAAGDVTKSLEALNTIYLDENQWRNPPQDTTPARIYEQWIGPDGILDLHKNTVNRGGKTIAVSAETTVRNLAAIDELKRQLEIFQRRCEQQGRELEALRGKKYRKGTFPTLHDAKPLFMAGYPFKRKGDSEGDPDHKKNIEWDLDRFISKFGANTKIDSLEGRELEINAWLNSLKTSKDKMIGPSRRMQVRLYVLKFLIDSGAMIDKKKIPRPTKDDIDSARKEIDPLTIEQAQKVIEKLPGNYADALRIQIRVGLRPDELLTLQKSNFDEGYSVLTLAPLGRLTLKTGPRKIPIPADLKPVLKARADAHEILFPEPKGKKATGGAAWRDPKAFNRRFKKALEAAALAADVKVKMDSRTGRRTCATLLINTGTTADMISKLLGNSTSMVLGHYGKLKVLEMDLNATNFAK